MTTENTINSTVDLAGLLGVSPEAVMTVIIVAILVAVGFYVFQSLAWQTIGRKQKYKRPWLAWIPFANISMILQMGRFHWAWVFLAIVPIAILTDIASVALITLIVISQWRIFEKAGYKGWLALLTLIPIVGLVVLGIIAWRKPSKKPVAKKIVKKVALKTAKKKVTKKVAKKKVVRKAKK